MAQQKVVFISNYSIGIGSLQKDFVNYIPVLGFSCYRNISNSLVWLDDRSFSSRVVSDSEAKIISDGFAKIQKMIDLQTATIKAIIERK